MRQRTKSVRVKVICGTTLVPELLVVQPAQGDWLLVDCWLLSESLQHKEDRFRLEGDVCYVCLSVRCQIILQTMANRLIDFFDEHIVQWALFVDVCELTRLCDQIVCILLGSHVGRMHIPQDGCIIFGDSFITCVFFEKMVYHFWI